MKFTTNSEGVLMEVVKAEMGFNSNTKARNLIKSGRITVDGNVNKIPSSVLKSGQIVALASKDSMKLKEELVLNHEIAYEDEFILVVNKRTGLITKSANLKLRTLFSDVKRYFKSKKIEDCFMVNSVDKKESGLVVFAKELVVFRELSEGWKSFRKRHYVVIPGGMLDEKGKLTDTFHQNDIGLLLPGGGKTPLEVELDYRVMKSNGQFSVIRVEGISGIKNEIRAMFACLKNPIVGDKKYRSEYQFNKGMACHFFSVELEYAGKSTEVKTGIPKLFLKMGR